MNVYTHFTRRGLPVSTGSTISKGNVWDIDDLLQFMKDEHIYGRFRIAEFIKRLYNENKAEVIRNFDDDETYHLILFFYKLLFTFEKDETYRRTYKSIINILAGGERLIGCPYHTKGVVLNSRAELAYCAPKSEIIGNALTASAKQLYTENLSERKRILNENCKTCIHDYHAPITYNEKQTEYNDWYWRNRIRIDSKLTPAEANQISAKRISNKQIFITGWYGTETVGDKAILAGIINELNAQFPDASYVVSSLYPLITERTMKELGILSTVIPVYSPDFVAYTKGSDLVIMGGGPLMDLEELALPLTAFKLAKSDGIQTMIFGCGIGPLFNKKFELATKKILELADVIKLRDQKSVDIATRWTHGKKNITLSGDPAKVYLNAKYAELQVPVKNILTCYLRDWTHEYAANLTEEDFLAQKEKMEAGLAQLIKQRAKTFGVEQIVLDHMHNFVVGNDDRDFSRYFIKKYFHDSEIPVTYNRKLSTIDSIVNAMKSSKHNICMRFHSVVFAHTLGADFTAFDYTLGGKILNYLTDNDQLQRMVTVNDIINIE
jgi:polysaccharide pyruvyl transferase WcaK-like protein